MILNSSKKMMREFCSMKGSGDIQINLLFNVPQS